MSNFIRLSLIVGLYLTLLPSFAALEPRGVAGLEQQTYEYEILRKGVPVGSHQVQLENRDDHTKVVSRSEIKIGLLGLTFYHFRYESQEEWDEQGLRRLLVKVDDDGEPLRIDGHRRGDWFVWTVNDVDSKTHEMPVYPTNHWNSSVLSQSRVLNTLTGLINKVSIQPNQEETLKFNGALGEVKGYRYSGELRLESWYDSNGRWMGMRFKGQDGSTIEYRCRNCVAWETS